MANGHDSRYKMLFSNPLMVKRLIDSFVDEPFLANEQILAIEPVDKETIGIDFSQRRSDMMWKLSTDSIECFVFVLLEFQSSVEKDMPFRVLEYLARLYRNLLERANNGSVPAIFPIVLYNGEEEWTAALRTQDLHEGSMPPPYFPHLSYYPIVIKDIPEDRLRGIHNAVSAVFLVENTEPDELPKTMDVLSDILKGESLELRRLFSRWLQQYMIAYGVPFSVDDIEKRIAGTESMFGTKLERYRNDMKEEGRQEGFEKATRALRLLQGGSTVEEVAEATGLPLSQVQELADEIRTDH